jgi:Mannose-6-phosphate isomerase
MKEVTNIYQIEKLSMAEEVISVLKQDKNIRIERIVSTGQVSGWYDQSEHEYVVLLEGKAALVYEDDTMVVLEKGDTLFIPAHKKHKVTYTSELPVCIWLCIFWSEEVSF